MFGQTAGVGETTISSKSNLSSLSIQNKAETNKKSEQKKIVKVVNFEEDSMSKNNNKIKIKTF